MLHSDMTKNLVSVSRCESLHSDLTVTLFCCHMLESPSVFSPELHLPLTLTLNRSHPHPPQNHQLGRFATQFASFTQHAYVVLRKQRSFGYVSTRLPVCTLHTNISPTNNGRATEGKTKGLDTPTATSRVLPKHNRRRDHGSHIVGIQFVRKTYNEVTKEQQKGGGGC